MRKFYDGIKSLIYWFPVIWNLRKDDYYEDYRFIRHRLKSLQKFYCCNKDVKAFYAYHPITCARLTVILKYLEQ